MYYRIGAFVGNFFKIFFKVVVLLTTVNSLAQTVTSVQSGNWNDSGTWDCNCVPDFNYDQITISAFTTVDIPSGFTADADEILVDQDGTLNILSGGKLIVRNGAGDDLVVTVGDGFFTFDGFLNVNNGGVLENRGTIISSVANTTITGTFLHNQNGGVIPEVTWNTGSTLEVSGITNTAPTGFNQIFYNLIWNSASQSASLPLGGALSQITNDLIVRNTGTNRALILQTSGSGTLSVGGDVIVENAASLGLTQSGDFTLNISGNLEVNSSSTNALLFVASGTATVNVQGNVIKSNTGNINFCTGSSLASGILNISGNLTFTSGGITETNSNSSSSGVINFIGNGLQNFSGGGSFSNTINFSVGTTSTLLFTNTTDHLGGAGSFTLNGTLQVINTDPLGAIQTGTSNGHIRVSGTRTYASGSTIVYNGSAAQYIGNGHPVTSGVNCVINNASGVSLSANATIGGNLTLTSGNLTVGNYTLTLGGNLTAGSNNIEVSSGSSLVINGTGPLGTFPFSAGPKTFQNFTLNRTSSGNVTFANPITITGSVVLNAGNLIFNGQTLELSGTLTATGGRLSGNSSSVLVITGSSGTFGSLPFDSGGNTINTLTINRPSGTVNLDKQLTITTALNLEEGTLNNASGLRLSNGATVTRTNGQLTGSVIVQNPGDRYDLIYDSPSSITTGVELPTVADDHLGNLTINGGPITLDKNIKVNGNLNLLNSTLISGGYDIEMAGNPGTWNRQGGSFNPGTSTVFISGNVSIQATTTPQFGNINVEDGATLTAYSGTVNILGNLQIDAGSVFNHNNGTLAFTGSTTQVLAGAGKTFNNITVNKSGGNLQLASTTNLLGALSVISSTTIESNGNLVLLSTSDGTSSNARVGPLPTGASVTGNVTVQRFMTDEGRIYRYLTAPVSGFTVASLQNYIPVTGAFSGSSTCTGCTSNPSMFRYDETVAGPESEGWLVFPSSSNTEQLQTGVGYAVFVRDNIIPGNVRIDWAGPMHQGSYNLPVTFTNTGNPLADGWNLVGNPYPSSIDWDNASGWTKTNISSTIAVRDNGAGGIFRYWDGSTGSFAGGQIATSQGFWVRAIAASPALVVNEQAKTTATATYYRKQDDTPADVLEIALNKDNITDYAYLRLRSEAQNGLDEYDGPKLNNENFDLFTFSSDSLAMAINALQELDCNSPLVLGLKDMAEGNYNLSVRAQGIFEQYRIILHDKFSGTNVELAPGLEYAFSVTSDPASKNSKRFYLTLLPAAEVHFTVNDNVLTSSYASGNQWYRDGLPIEGATGQTLEVTEAGTYTLAVQIGTCTFAAPESYSHVVTGIEPVQKELMVFPNPAVNKLTIQLRSGGEAIAGITSVNGNMVKAVRLRANGEPEEVDISDLGAGMYIVTINRQGKFYRTKFLKINR